MNFKTILLLFILTLLFSLPVTAQEASVCKSKISDLPRAAELYGFHLGMTIDEAREHLPQLKLGRTDEYGDAKGTVNPEFVKGMDKAGFQGVRSISLEFLDGKLYSLGIGYNSEFKWQTMEEFLPGISHALNLSSEWESKSWRGREMDCDGLHITARMIGGSPSLSLYDKAAKQLLEQRISAKEEPEETH